MKAWQTPPPSQLPQIPDMPALQVWDTATGQLQPAVAPGARDAAMYVCGITPYDATHLGHAATYVAFDVLNRVLRDQGVTPKYVQNVTDVDDPLLKRAADTGVDWRELADSQTQLFREDMAALNVLPPNEFFGATEAIELLVPVVESLLRDGVAYLVPGDGENPAGDVYLDVHADPEFGSVSHLSETQMLQRFADNGGDPQRAGKRHPLDALLWRAARAGEPSWDGAALGPGRPGWHIECSVIATHLLGMPIDIQGGGRDLVFPHHEMSATHAQLARHQHPFARRYLHTGMVGLDGEKMSKSKGNLVFVSQLRREGIDPNVIRLVLLSHHYRDDWMFDPAMLTDAEQRLSRWRAAARVVPRKPGDQVATRTLMKVRSALSKDLDTPNCVAALNEWSNAVLEGDSGVYDGMASVVSARLLGIQLS